jgi:hypothetical protein
MKSYMVSQTDPEHPTDELLLALIHEQPVDDAAAIRGHMMACQVCDARSRELSVNDATIDALLAALDHPLAARRGTFVSRNGWRLRRAALVAGATATMAAAAAAVVPGSPLHRWIADRSAAAATSAPVHAAASAAPVAATAAAAGEAPLASGIAIPAAPTLIVAFRREQQGGAVEIARTAAGGDVSFRSRGGVTAYDVADGQVSIDNQAPADLYLIDIPATVRTVRIRVAGRTLVRWPEDSAKLVSAADPQRARVVLDLPGAKGP